jgi:transposase
MTDEQIKEQIEILERVTKEISRSKKAARKFLREAGIPVGDEPFGTKKKKMNHA